ncbi:major head protein [Xanthomonas phage vB_XveM_DIBBI]|uniref:Major capsid protein n=2 Tax=Dibbivirus TaxID=2843374 RepID=A0A513ZYI7_9CAUD|nr:major head protein [Xanthomonas phage vB_XveM_DIBBI]YP_009845943.1 major head protein [Pantoea phage vB_PagM_PSKM]AEX65677.1 hypothetical protein DIBBI_009 [Xanthomonas phage vB_XveM_DIBBI]QDH45766.1 major capsid protein [Pantoea phage vB_PagM_PSKM]
MHERYDEFDLETIIAQAMANGQRMDEGQSIFLARQLDYLKTKAYEVEYGPMSALSIFPVTNELPDDVRTFTYGIWDAVGMAKIIADYSDDLPSVDANYREETGRIWRLGDSYHYSLDELKAAQRTGRDLSARKATAARKAFDTKVNDLVWLGDADHQILGLFEQPNVPLIASAGWTTAAIAVEELQAAVDGIATVTKGNHRANRIVIPPSVNKVLSALIPNTQMTYGDLFNKTNPNLQWEQAYELENIDGSNKRGVLVFEYDADNMSIELPEEFNQLPPQARNLHWQVPCTGKATGLTIYRPLTMQFITGV